MLNDPLDLDAQQQAQLDARLREEALRNQALRNQALARAQERLHAESLSQGGHQPDQQRPAPAVHQPVPAARHNPPTPETARETGLQSGGLDFIGGDRNVKDFLRADRHSGKVRFLRVAFPLAGVFILSVVIGAYWWSLPSAPSVSVQSAGIENGKMVMKNPKLAGVDDKQRPYTLIAREAIQDPAVPNEVELTDIDAKVPMEEGIFAKILAGKGFYDSKAKTLKLDKNVDIRTDDGMSMTLTDADVDMDAGNLLTSNPVSILTEQAKISADSLSVENNGEKVVFENRVRMTLYPDKIQDAQKSSGANSTGTVQAAQ